MSKSLALCVSWLAVGCSLPDDAAEEGPTAKETSVSALVPVVAAHGAVRVIVGVRAPAQPEGTLDPIERAGQRAQIAEAQRTATERLARAGTRIKAFAAMPYLVLRIEDTAGLDALAADPDVMSIEPDLALPPTLDVSTGIVGARTAWASGYHGEGWAVAVLDTGVMKTHTHLAGKVISEACYSTTDGANGSTSLCPGGAHATTATGSGVNCTVASCDHGTHVAATATSGHGTYGGVANGASVIAMQVFSQFSSQTLCGSSTPCVLSYSSDWLEGLERVLSLAQSGTHIAAVNLSLGGGMYTGSCDATFASIKTAIDQLASVGIATVVAAGNDGYTNAVGFPGCISSAVTVGATTKADAVASYSNISSAVDVLAPGSAIYAAVTTSTTAVGGRSGTSMATPHVAGAFALMRSARPTMTVAQGVAALQATGASITDTRGASPVTKPRIAVAAAISSLATPAACTRQAPAITIVQPGAVEAPTTVRFTARITNRDQATCSAQAFDVVAAVPARWTATAAATTLAPGATAEVGIDVTPPADASGTQALTITATNASMTAFSATATASYLVACDRAAPDLAIAPTGARTLAVHVTNHDDPACGASTTFHMSVTSALALSPTEGDVIVDNGADRFAELAIGTAEAGPYTVRVTLADPTGAIVADQSMTVTIADDGTADTSLPDLNLGCRTTRGSGGAGVLLAIGLVLRRRRR